MSEAHPISYEGVKAENLYVLAGDTFRGKKRVLSYVDLTTGQVVPNDIARGLGIRCIWSDAKERRRVKLNSLRTEPRRFAAFLLRFRDAHCKFLMPMDVLVGWFSALTGKQQYHIRRYFKPLIAAGILDSENTLNEDFMVSNPTAGRETSKGDVARAYRIYDVMRDKLKLETPSTSMTMTFQ